MVYLNRIQQVVVKFEWKPINKSFQIAKIILRKEKTGNVVILYFTNTAEISNQNSIVQFSSVTQSCPTLCNPMKHSTPGLPVHHKLPEFTQIHVHWVSDAILPSHPLSSPSPPAPNPSQHQSLFQ